MRSVVLAVGFLFSGAALGVTTGYFPSLALVLYGGAALCFALVFLTWPPVVRRMPVIGPWYARHQRRPINELKRDCAALSVDILRFVKDRKRHEPTLMFGSEHWQEGTDAIIRYGVETSAEYHERFGAKALAVVSELRDRGLPVPSVPRPDFQVNTIGMSMLAQEIGLIGEQLPDS